MLLVPPDCPLCGLRVGWEVEGCLIHVPDEFGLTQAELSLPQPVLYPPADPTFIGLPTLRGRASTRLNPRRKGMLGTF